jgi:hypothetical protein
MSRNYSLVNQTEKLAMNFFIIREVYGYMASVDKIKNPKKKFYQYLEISEEKYDKLVELGVGQVDRTVQLLIECGYSDTLFRKDAPTLIKMSDTLFDTAYEYKFNKSLTLPEFHDFLCADIGSIQNPDNTLLVVSTRRLISRITANATPDDTLLDFVDILDDFEFDEHNTQKTLINEISSTFQKYQHVLDDLQNTNE